MAKNDGLQFRVSEKSLRSVLRNIEKFGDRVAGAKAIEAAADVYYAEVKKAISKRDHSRAALKGLDYPYARRHGSIQVHPRKPWFIHRQQGDLIGALGRQSVGRGRRRSVLVYFDDNAAPHAKWVIGGTRTKKGGGMLPRPVLDMVATDPLVQKKMLFASAKHFLKVVKRGIR